VYGGVQWLVFEFGADSAQVKTHLSTYAQGSEGTQLRGLYPGWKGFTEKQLSPEFTLTECW